MTTNFAPTVAKMSNEESTHYTTMNAYNYTRFIINQRLDYASRLSSTDVASLTTLLDTFVSTLDNFISNINTDEK